VSSAPVDVAIREVAPQDAARFLALCLALDAETTYMMLEPGERQTTVAEQRAEIAATLASGNSTILVAAAGHELAGYVAVTGGRYRRERQTGYIVAGVRQAYAGQGLGTRLFEALEVWARAHGLHRLELTVQGRNTAAVRLYTRQGFEIEGTRRQPLLVAGAFVDELYMAKLLN
jgi:RimJ/RimL family protein N-acetyltransferase